jgi:hypothetical protein
VEISYGNFNNPFLSKANYFSFLLGASPPYLTSSHELGVGVKAVMSSGCQLVRFHCVCVIADLGDAAGISFIPITTNNCDSMIALAHSSFVKKERKRCKGDYTVIIKKYIYMLTPKVSS